MSLETEAGLDRSFIDRRPAGIGMLLLRDTIAPGIWALPRAVPHAWRGASDGKNNGHRRPGHIGHAGARKIVNCPNGLRGIPGSRR
jgi:hypothetical protein